MTNFTTAMDKLAAEIAAACCNPEGAGTPGGATVIPLGDKIDAFKALMPYYALLKKNENNTEDDDDAPTFENFQNAIHKTETSDGTAEPGVRDRRRN